MEKKMDIAKMLINYPELFSNDKLTAWDGYITIPKSKSYRTTLQVPKFPSIDDISYLIPTITDASTLEQIDSIPKNCSNIHDYLKNLTDILTEHTKLTDEFSVSNRLFFRNLLESYKKIAKHPNVTKVETNGQLTEFKITAMDLAGRKHFVMIVVTPERKFKIMEHYLPKVDELLEENENFTELFEQYYKIVGNLQSFFDCMDSIDGVCWVVDPVKPTTKDCRRRIVLGPNISIQLTFDPWDIKNIPKIQFMGTEAVVAPIRDSYINNLENWDPDYDIVQNILRLLDLPFFPMKPNADDEDEKNELDFELNECCICFCVRLEEELPDQICKNCEQHFHKECLYQWLSSIGTFHPNFQLAQGECPNCKKAITCPIPKSVAS